MRCSSPFLPEDYIQLHRTSRVRAAVIHMLCLLCPDMLHLPLEQTEGTWTHQEFVFPPLNSFPLSEMLGTHQARFCSLHWVIYLALVCLGKEISYHDHALCAGEWCQRGPSQQAGASVSTNSAIPCLKWAGTCPDKRGWGSDTSGGWSVPAVRKAKRLSLPLSPGPSQWLGRATESRGKVGTTLASSVLLRWLHAGMDYANTVAQASFSHGQTVEWIVRRQHHNIFPCLWTYFPIGFCVKFKMCYLTPCPFFRCDCWPFDLSCVLWFCPLNPHAQKGLSWLNMRETRSNCVFLFSLIGQGGEGTGTCSYLLYKVEKIGYLKV